MDDYEKARRWEVAKAVVDKQAEDDGLWSEKMPLPSIFESYMQQEMRKLHAAIEGE